MGYKGNWMMEKLIVYKFMQYFKDKSENENFDINLVGECISREIIASLGEELFLINIEFNLHYV